MNLDKETLAKWKEDAKKAWYEGKFSNENLPPLASIHIANACPKNFIALIEKLERYEKALKFYANENHFNHLSVLFDCDAEGIQCGGGFAVVDDGIIEKGRVAQEALND